jgi:hypothetical protein
MLQTLIRVMNHEMAGLCCATRPKSRRDSSTALPRFMEKGLALSRREPMARLGQRPGRLLTVCLRIKSNRLMFAEKTSDLSTGN